MMHRIRRIEPLTAAKVAGILYAILGLIAAPFFWMMTMAAPEGSSFSAGFVLILPIAYGALGFVFTLVGAALYNVVAGWVGGVELDLEPTSGVT